MKSAFLEPILLRASSMPVPLARSVLTSAIALTSKRALEDVIPRGRMSRAESIHRKREATGRLFEDSIGRVLKYAKHETLRNMERHFRTVIKAAGGKPPVDLPDPPNRPAVRIIFNPDEFQRDLLAALESDHLDALQIAGQELFDELGRDDPWRMPARAAVDFIRKRQNLLSGVSDEIHKEIEDDLAEGIDNQEPLRDLVKRISGKFEEIYKGRGKVIADTETAAAYSYSRNQAMRAAGVERKKWLHSPLAKVPRPEHIAMHGRIVPIDEAFPTGTPPLMYPHDPNGSAEDVINCFLPDTEISAFGVLKSYRRLYSGPIVNLITISGVKLPVTPNHPMLTLRGWIAAGKLKRGDCIICISRSDDFSQPWIEPNKQDVPATFFKVHRSLSVSGKRKRMRGRPMDFHGDGKSSKVDIVFADGLLRYGKDAAFCEQFPENAFTIANLVKASFCSDGAALQGRTSISLSSPGSPSALGIETSCQSTQFAHSDKQRFRKIAPLNPLFNQSAHYDRSANSQSFSDRILRFASNIRADEILDIEFDSVVTFAHNLETKSGWYLAQGYFSRNCRCIVIPVE